MVDAGSIWIRLGLDTEQLRFGLDKAKYGLMQWRDETNRNSMEMAKWGAAIGATIAPITAMSAAAYSAIQTFGAMADEINDLAYTTGLSTDKIQQLQYAAILSNTAFSTVTMGANTFTLAVAKAGDASSDAGKAFAELNVATNGRSYDEVFEDAASALMSMEDTTRRNDLAMTLYGRSWKEMLPFMQTYIDKKKEFQSISLLTPQELKDNEQAKAELDALGKRIETYEGKIVAYRDDAGSTVLDRLLAGKGLGAFVPEDTNALTKFNKAFLSKPALGAKTTASAASKVADPFAGMSAEEAEIALMRDYTIPGLQDKYDELASAAVPDMEAIAAASLELIKAKQDLIDLTTKETDAQKGLKDATADYIDELDKLNDINKDYSRDLQSLDPTDVQGFLSLTQRHGWNVQDQQAAIGQAQGKVSAAASGAKYGDVVINLEGKTLARIPGVAAGDPMTFDYSSAVRQGLK